MHRAIVFLATVCALVLFDVLLCRRPVINSIFVLLILPILPLLLSAPRLTGMGRSKFLPKPLPHEINMLLTECDMNCYPDPSGKSITTMASSASIAKSTDTKASIIQSDTSSQSITANNSADSYNGNCMDTLDDDDDDDNRIG